MFGYTGSILRVDLTEKKITKVDLNEEDAKKYIGGRGLATKILYDEVPQGIDPLGPENKLIFMTGPFTGTIVPTAGRYDVVAKSPLTGFYGAANSGGFWGAELKYAGYDGILLEGVSDEPCYLWIDDESVSIESAKDLWGKTINETEKLVKEELGDGEIKVACIGPAGENLVRFAAIMNDETRAAGRTGMGAVMGSKRLKAIAVRGTGDVKVPDIDNLMNVISGRIKEVGKYETLSITLDHYGSPGVVSYVNAIGAFPSYNFQTSVLENAEDIDGETIKEEALLRKSACFGCTIGCGRVTKIPFGKYSGEVGEGPEYENINTLGSRCGNSDLSTILKAHNLCNELGLDAITAGSVIAFAMECFEKGVIGKDDTGGLDFSWGNTDTIVDILKKIAVREGFGDILAEGVRGASEKLGKASEDYAIHIKGLDPPGYEPRAMKGAGFSYATASRGGDHLGSLMSFCDLGMTPLLVPAMLDALVLDEEKIKLTVELEDWLALVDSLVLCKFYAFCLTKEEFVNFMGLIMGGEFSIEDARKIGERNWNIQRLYNLREGVARKDDTLPKRFFEEKLPEGVAKGHLIEKDFFDKCMDQYYELRGWDKNGVPTEDQLKKLELEV